MVRRIRGPKTEARQVNFITSGAVLRDAAENILNRESLLGHAPIPDGIECLSITLRDGQGSHSCAMQVDAQGMLDERFADDAAHVRRNAHAKLVTTSGRASEIAW